MPGQIYSGSASMRLFRNSIFSFLLMAASIVGLQAQDVEITDLSDTPVSCGGFSDGTLSVSISGGRSPYTYLLLNYLLQPVDKIENTASTTETFPNLLKGTYIVLVTDVDSSAAAEFNVHVGGPDVIQITYANASDIRCNNSDDGVITVNATGEKGNYIFDLTAVSYTHLRAHETS